MVWGLILVVLKHEEYGGRQTVHFQQIVLLREHEVHVGMTISLVNADVLLDEMLHKGGETIRLDDLHQLLRNAGVVVHSHLVHQTSDCGKGGIIQRSTVLDVIDNSILLTRCSSGSSSSGGGGGGRRR